MLQDYPFIDIDEKVYIFVSSNKRSVLAPPSLVALLLRSGLVHVRPSALCYWKL